MRWILGVFILVGFGSLGELEASSAEAWKSALRNYMAAAAGPVSYEDSLQPLADYLGYPELSYELESPRLFLQITKNERSEWLCLIWLKNGEEALSLRDELRAFFDTWLFDVSSEEELEAWKGFRRDVMRALIYRQRADELYLFSPLEKRFGRAGEDRPISHQPEVYRFASYP